MAYGGFHLWQRVSINSRESGMALPLSSRRQFLLFLTKLRKPPCLTHAQRIFGNACWTF